MNENYYSTGTRQDEGMAWSAGIAYIVIPSDIDRAKYIAECFRTSTVSIYSEHNGYTNRVPIDIMSLNFISFPQKVGELGSAVCFIIEPIQNRPIINGIYHKEDEVSGLKENQFRFKRELDGNVVEIIGSPDSSVLGLTVKAIKGGVVSIKIDSDDDSGKLNVTVDGDINITSLGNTTLKQYGKLSVATVSKEDEKEFAAFEQDSSHNEFFDEAHKINTGKLTINSGEEPFLLGKKFKQFMDYFIEEVGNTTITTAIGQMPLLNKVQIQEYKNKTQDLLSEIGFIDK